MRALGGQIPTYLNYWTDKHMASATQHYVRTGD